MDVGENLTEFLNKGEGEAGGLPVRQVHFGPSRHLVAPFRIQVPACIERRSGLLWPRSTDLQLKESCSGHREDHFLRRSRLRSISAMKISDS